MKKLKYLAALIVLSGAFCSGAQQITPAQQNVLDQFGLDENDHRGVEFNTITSACQIQYPNVKNAIEAYFTTLVKRDYTKICIQGPINDYFDQPLGIMELVDLYIELSDTQIEEDE